MSSSLGPGVRLHFPLSTQLKPDKGPGSRPFRKLLWPWGLKGLEETGGWQVGQ